MRMLLVLVLVHGLAPGLVELGETAVHWVGTGHVAHTAADRGDLGDLGDEHGCGATQHHCNCCATQLLLPSAGIAVASLHAGAERPVAPRGLRLAARDPARPFRPPIS